MSKYIYIYTSLCVCIYIYIIPLLIFLIKWRHPGGASHFLLSAAPRVKIKREIAYKMVCFAITGLGRSLLGTVIL